MKPNALWLNLTLAGGLALGNNFLIAPAFAVDEENFHYAVALMSDHEEYSAAAEKFRAFADANPDNPRAPAAWFYLANCYAKMHKEQTAGEIYEKLYRIYPTHELAEKALCFAADCYFRAALFERAIELYGQLARRPHSSPLAATAIYWRAESYARMLTAATAAGATGDNPAVNAQLDQWYRAAQSDFLEFVKTPQTLTADALYSAGALAFDRRDYLTAQARLTRLLREFPEYAQNETAAYYLAESFYWQDNFAAADQSYGALLDKFPRGKYRAAAIAGRGWCAYARQKFGEAGKFFAAAADNDDTPAAGQFRFDAGAAFEESGDLTAAKAQFAQVPAGNPRRGAALLRQAIIVRKQEKDSPESLAAAEKFLTQAEQCDGDHHAETLALLGETQLKLKNFAAAIGVCQDAVSRYPDSKFTAFAQYQLAQALAQTNDFSRAATVLQDLQRQNRDPHFRLLALNLLADCEKALGNHAAAISAWKQLLFEAETAMAEPSLTAVARELAARTRLNIGEMTGDPAMLASLRQEFPDSPAAVMAQIRLGEITEKKSAFADAVKHYESALTLLAASASALPADNAAIKMYAEYRLGALAVLAANQLPATAKTPALSDAIRKLQTFRKNYPAAPESSPWRNRALYYIAEAECALDNYADAARNYRECYELAPQDEFADAALFGLAWSQNKTGDSAGAIAAWQKLLAAFPQSEYRAESLFLLIGAQQNLGDLAGAKNSLAQLKIIEKNSDRALIEEAKIAEKSGDSAAAEKILSPYLTKEISHPARDRALHALSWLYWRRAEPQLKIAGQYETELKTFLNGRKLRDLPADQQARAVELRAQWLQARDAGRNVENQMMLTLEKILADYPDFSGRAAAALRLGESLYDRGDFARAESCYQQIIAANDASLLDKAYYRLGGCAWRSSELPNQNAAEKKRLQQTAIDYFQKVYTAFADSEIAGESAWQAAEILRANGDNAAAMPVYRLIENFSTRDEIKSGARYQAAVCLLELQRYRDALTAFQELLRSSRKADETWFPEANWGAGQAAMSLGLYAEARAYFINAKADNYGGEAAAKARYGLGAIELAQGNLQLAREEFRKVEVFHSGWTEISADALLKAAACSRELGETASAIKDLQRVLKKYPDAAAATPARELLAQLPVEKSANSANDAE